MSIKIDDVPISEYNIRCELDHEHPALPSTRDYTISIPGMAGAYDYGADMGVRDFELPMVIQNVDSNIDISLVVRRFKRAILDEYGNPKTFKLLFDYEPDKYYNARYSGNLPLERLVYRGRFVLPLTAFDPFAYSVVMNDEVTWGSTVIDFNSIAYTYGNTGGKTHSVIYPAKIIETVTGDSLRPIFKINGSGTNVSISSNGQSFSLGSFKNTNWIVDGDNYTVIRNGINGLKYFSGDWIEFINGENQITISGTGLNLTFECLFRDKYM